MIDTTTLPNPIFNKVEYYKHLEMIESKRLSRANDLYQTPPHEDTVRAIDTYAKLAFPYNREIASWLQRSLGETETNYDLEATLNTEVYLAQCERQKRIRNREVDALRAQGYSLDLGEVHERAIVEGKRMEIYLSKDTILGKVAEPKLYRPVKMIDGVRAVMPKGSKTKGYRLDTFANYNCTETEFALARVEK